jgi:hypothetical protein
VQIADIVHYVRLEVPGSMDLIIIQNLAAVAKDFCSRTLVWTVTQPGVPLREGVSEYDIEGVPDATIAELTDVWTPRRRLMAKTQAGLDLVLPDWQTAAAASPDYYSVGSDHKLLVIYPKPLNAQRALLTMRVRYTPTRTAQVLPDFLVEEHLDALVDGCKARMFKQVNVPWSNPPAAMAASTAYEDAVIKARITELHGNVPSSLRVQPRRFG